MIRCCGFMNGERGNENENEGLDGGLLSSNSFGTVLPSTWIDV